MKSNGQTHPTGAPKTYDRTKFARELLHEIQNHLHLAMMEAELAQMGACERIDSNKILAILDSLKNSVSALRNYLISSGAVPREDRMTSLNRLVADLRTQGEHGRFTVKLMRRHDAPIATVDIGESRGSMGQLLEHCAYLLNEDAQARIKPDGVTTDQEFVAKISFEVTVAGESP